MSREIKFRAWDKVLKRWCKGGLCMRIDGDGLDSNRYELMQYTGFKDKNGLICIYEGDIIDSLGNIKGNIYEMDAGETDTVIQGFGTKTWCETYRRAILLGCIDSE